MFDISASNREAVAVFRWLGPLNPKNRVKVNIHVEKPVLPAIHVPLGFEETVVLGVELIEGNRAIASHQSSSQEYGRKICGQSIPS
jgi:hypothetical protein